MATLPADFDFDGASVPELHELMHHQDPLIQSDAACALGDRLRTRELDTLDNPVVETLRALIGSKSFIVQFEAAITLAELQDHTATELLLHASQSRRFRLDAIRALGTLGNPAAIEPLRAMLGRFLLPWADKLQAAAALCALGDSEGQSYLLERLSSRRDAERASAIHFLGESKHPDALTYLEHILGDTEDPMRDVAARTLTLLPDELALPILEKNLVTAKGELLEELQQCADSLRNSAKSVKI